MNWKQCVALGLCSVGEYKGEPVAYLYNGVQLPALPEWDRGKYPYAMIRNASLFQRNLYVFSSDDWQKSEGTEYLYNTGSYQMFITSHITTSPSYGVWTYKQEGEGLITAVNDPSTIWANCDIPNSDGTLYLAATDPIPVYA